MRLLRQAKLSLLAAAIFMAPLLCLRFCQLREDVAHTASPASMAHAHAHAVPGHAQHTDDGEHHAPLNDLKQMMLAVTEFVPVAVLAFVIAVTASRAIPIAHRLRKMTLDVLTPPPRFSSI